MNRVKDDKYYIDRIVGGDVNAFSYLVDKYKGMVYTLSLKFLKNAEDAEELAQDVFIKVFNGLKDFKFDSKFSTWLYRITYNAAISKLRKKQIETRDIENVSLPESQVLNTYNAVNELTKQEQIKYIKLVLEKLNEEDSVILTLFYLQENSIQEICEITGYTESNVKVKLHRARKTFYDELQFILKDEVISIL
jgi:RNA polymerase sigma-70 factor (ECF subfamily)